MPIIPVDDDLLWGLKKWEVISLSHELSTRRKHDPLCPICHRLHFSSLSWLLEAGLLFKLASFGAFPIMRWSGREREGGGGGVKMLRGNVLSKQLFVCGGEGIVLHYAPRPHTKRYRRRAQYKETREVSREIEELSVEKSNAKHY